MRLRRTTIEKSVLTAVLTAWFVAGPQVGYDCGLAPKGPLYGHLLYMISHANVWHLLGNVFVLWIIKGRLYLTASAVTAFLASFMPAFGLIWPLEDATMGFSGVIFAIFGVQWGVYCQSFWPGGREIMREALGEFSVKALPFAVLGMVVPHVNWCLHLYCLLGGFAYGRWRWKHFLR